MVVFRVAGSYNIISGFLILKLLIMKTQYRFMQQETQGMLGPFLI
jgi:hypothetical protein